MKIDRDPLLDRIKPGVLRMREAEAWLAEYLRNRHKWRVDWNAPHRRGVNAAGLLSFAGGARGRIWASQITTGTKNALRFRTAGEKGGLAWDQENPDLMDFTLLGDTTRLLRRGDGLTQAPSRTPSGHPEGYLEAFATLYADAADLIEGKGLAPAGALAMAEDGLAGMRFVSACVRSSEAGGVWTPA